MLWRVIYSLKQRGKNIQARLANCSLGWQRELILDRSPSEDICAGNHFVLWIKSAGIKAILLLGGRELGEDSKLVVVQCVGRAL